MPTIQWAKYEKPLPEGYPVKHFQQSKYEWKRLKWSGGRLSYQEWSPWDGLHVKQQTFASVTNVGVRPTVANVTPSPRIETHLFDFNQRLYDEFLNVRFLARVRDEKRFGSLDELKEQIGRDSACARDWFTPRKS